ncbi:MAG: helix-turn-helix domain-containing protein [Panacagrimonas sp.]
MCRNFVSAHGSTPDRDAFDARFTVCSLGEATVFGMTAPLQSWDRSPTHIRRAPNDDFLVTLMMSGDGRLRQDGREVIQRPGTMLLYDTSLPYSYELSGETLAVKMPRQALLSRVSEPVRPAEPLSSTSNVGVLAAGLIRQAANLDLPAARSPAVLIGSSLLDIVAALLDSASGEPGTRSGSERASLLERVRRYAIRNLGDPDLSVNSMARFHCVSARTLVRAFAASGTTPMRWVWQERLEASRRALQTGPEKRVTDVAFDHGFSGLSHFSRAFKTAFGESPRQITNRERGAP